MKSSAIRESAVPSNSSNRRTSARQQRTGTSRPTNYYARTFSGRAPMADNASASMSTPGFFPAITHFTDSINALPKEVMKHFSMMREVEAKTDSADSELKVLSEKISAFPPISRQQARLIARSAANSTGSNSLNGSVAGSVVHGQQGAEQSESGSNGQATEEDSQLQRRQVFYRYRYNLAQMCGMLDEKNAVLSSANQTVEKQLARMESSYVHIDEELSYEARYGSTTHWAYKDGDDKNKKAPANERSRREVAAANNLAAAAAAVHEGDIAATRGDSRRDGLHTRHKNRNHYVDSDFDDRPTKKAPASRSKKTTDITQSAFYGLGITHTPNQASKRRKTEKTATSAPAMERSMSGAIKDAAGGRASPRETPAAESKKRSRAAPAPAPAKKRTQAVGHQSPHVPSSPVIGNFGVPGAAAQRPMTSRGRQNSTSNSTASVHQEPSRQRPPSSASNRPINGVINSWEAEPGAPHGAVVPVAPPGVTAESPAVSNGNLPERTMKREETDAHEGAGTPSQTVITRAGRASKTATPVIGSFPEGAPMARSRSTRNNGSHASSESNVPLVTQQPQKRSHKKGASALQRSAANHVDDGSSLAGDLSGPDLDEEVVEEEDDGDQERFCYCNGVSYGEMIGCDNPDCARQWFHYACVGITKEPNKKAKWYCEDCKENLNLKRSRPVSRQ
ncbi:uncharacterized protein K452DRAFT_302283 [Aplosporella prunicola CBS 121167]|uniref:Chromatin modification-related protein n=1 Tax=Aplosporella prunicola CBS 121167 TaxID=1176127 RepID=A0A6A6B1U2_9PEZI|nr:uncharacterized protein K452DRAFT_302528 [Aplosporella prunicola CBS 121167]XP_033392705.1 uncharacterized protein K452DRAFT_302283 [Aplosporella prunicola CBS 121167]KAF2136750.1 hypothetical protein K452DRAFT_302528 [Aplosporella prunicola CBS 121167]KAF2136987.1 hypothetical protein K452DRAFT_302283 [Aplosporella prunicola CBS 121167]